MENDKLSNPWPGVPHTLPNTLSFSNHSKETVASVNAYLLKMAIDIAQENVNLVKTGHRQDITFESQLAIVRKIAKFFNPAWR